MKKLLCLSLLIASGGCAVHRPLLLTETQGTNGVVTKQRLSMATWALWPATTEIARQKASVGKTLSLGVEGLREDGGGTNMTDALKYLDSILGKISK